MRTVDTALKKAHSAEKALATEYGGAAHLDEVTWPRSTDGIDADKTGSAPTASRT